MDGRPIETATKGERHREWEADKETEISEEVEDWKVELRQNRVEQVSEE